MSRYILLSGKRCVGKSTVANILFNILKDNGYNVAIKPLADELKRETAIKYNLDFDRLINDYNYKDEHRKKLIDVGREAKQIHGLGVWVNKVAASSENIVIVPDIRYLTELAEFKKYKVDFTLRIEADDVTRSTFGWVPNNLDLDPSETELDDYPFQNIFRNSFSGDTNYILLKLLNSNVIINGFHTTIATVYPRKKGSITLIHGPMYAQKSTELIAAYHREERAGKRCIMIKHAKDTRYTTDDYVVTHDGQKHLAISCSNLEDINNDTFDAIFIDEGQFFSNLYNKCLAWADIGKVVVVAGLDSDFQRKPFGDICNLMAIAEKIISVSGICRNCKGPSKFTMRTTDSKEIELIGGDELYAGVCRQCYTLHSNN